MSTPLLTYLFSEELPPLLDLSPEPLLPPLAFSAMSLALSIRPDMFADFDVVGSCRKLSVGLMCLYVWIVAERDRLVKLYRIVEQHRHWDHMQAT